MRMAGVEDVPALVEYLGDFTRDNGAGGAPLFQPQARGAEWHAAERLEMVQRTIGVAVGDRNWRRFWLAFDRAGAIAGHVDLRALPDPYTPHRALLGLGVHRDHRRRGLGRWLLQLACHWAITESRLEWLDLDVLAANHGARALYEGAGFILVAKFTDKFRIDGESIDEIHMTKALVR